MAAEDRRGLRRLLRYGARPALAARRVSLLEGMVVYRLRKPTATGRTQLQMTPQQFIRRLAALTPPPWLNLIRFYGVFASAHRQRQAIAQRVAQQPRSGRRPVCLSAAAPPAVNRPP
ncbi:MAG: transposase [Proteobacteria bacterium]|nr:transposase [Pseudomonadota bacterium]